MWFSLQNQHVTVQIIAKPNAKKTALVKITPEGLHIALHAKPHKGAANKELTVFLSDFFAIPKSRITLKTGENSRHKQVVMPLTDALQERLEALGQLLNQTSA
ncbi:hypothetical protein Lgee_1420 [Legionella geestiana]|uniref:UPF0235 protein Lgee_1420 n=2 Tax=Legionella geestiana TaxID=45065 RepID=A0A0W0TTV2_9GAMM|nr:hypothetical protein Lgee_1420 [Legionella geestiana]QBS13447.1 DUF167 domain-containing protein [Legionella geestiana]QDQ41069.1 DUF167 domain-containing protein [Legionella geestiana]STX54761.1 Uncharacterised ACR, YggU family COG1872 [Legionella geestiana]